jgi:hypothetical protein
MSKPYFDAELQQQLAELCKDKQPERDLWQGIELALASQEAPMHQHNNRPRVAGSKIYLIAATLGAFAMFAWILVNQHSQVLVGDSLVAVLSAQHQPQKNALLVKFQDQPALTQNWQEQLDELD